MAPPWELPMVEAQKKAAAKGDPIPGGIPASPSSPLSGKEILDKLKTLSGADREKFMVQLLKDGNVPDFLRDMSTVEFEVADANGTMHTVKYQVTPDYLAVGTNEDYVFVPLSAQGAQEVALAWDMSPPTAKMVDQLNTRGIVVDFRQGYGTTEFAPYSSAAAVDAYGVRNEKVRGEDYTAAFWKTVGDTPDGQVMTHADLGGGPVSGHMKDIVMTEKVTAAADRAVQAGDTTPDKIGLYHPAQQKQGEAMAADHNVDYVDYSQGLRMVSPIIEVDGTKIHISEVLAGQGTYADYHTLLSGEGPMDNPALFADRPNK